MPSFKHKENAGALFKNKQRETEKHPLYKGELNVEGKMFWLNAWLNESQRTGEKYLAIRLTPKEEKQRLKVVGGTDSSELDDEIPF